ncbi:MAG: hypothetical protein NVSMB19_18060 [Vulcanimicrobiaceae bacterium]
MKRALPSGPAGPGGPVGPGTQSKSRVRAALPFALGVVVLISAFNLFLHHENRYEKLATDVTHAIAANDMRPVEKEFNAIRRPQLENRAEVGRLSDFVNADGKLKSIKEQAAPAGKPDTHRFIATFEKGQRAEDLTVDAEGKITSFHVTPLETK